MGWDPSARARARQHGLRPYTLTGTEPSALVGPFLRPPCRPAARLVANTAITEACDRILALVPGR
ncbi:hypothetical protein FBZ92_11384 [Nitrospirillum viridazoti]|uniref:Uncharacterized protein n=1 Tax=Nitrospirillum amazonense TaxID=28077 RepID=A0A560IDC2_9PROT|nr:hypothetical protein FBZ92_11384 [Nitrospirillum amazonense]